MAKRNKEEEKDAMIPVTKGSIVQANDVPDYLKEFSGMGSVGLENIRRDDMVMPRLAIAQGLSPQIKKHESAYIPGLEEGDFFNTLTGEIYGTRINLIPLTFFPSRVFFSPRGSTEPERCRTNKLDVNGELISGRITPEGCAICPHSAFLTIPRPDGSISPDCTYFMNYMSLIHKGEGEFEPIVFSVKSAMIKPAKAWNSKLRVKRAPGFLLETEIETIPEKAKKGTFYNVKFGDVNYAASEDVETLKQMFTFWSNRQIEVDMRDMAHEVSEEAEILEDTV